MKVSLLSIEVLFTLCLDKFADVNKIPCIFLFELGIIQVNKSTKHVTKIVVLRHFDITMLHIVSLQPDLHPK